MDRDPGILTCCYSRTQVSGFPSALISPLNTHPLLSPGIQAFWSQSPLFVLTAKLPVLGSSNLGPLHSQLESQILKLSFQLS